VAPQERAAIIPVFVISQLAQQGLQSVWVPYTTHRFDWSVTDVGLSLAVVGLLFAIAQRGLVRPIVGRLGELNTLKSSVVVAAIGMLLFGLASPGWMMHGVTALLGLGLLGPVAQGLMSRSVPDNEQGLLQRAVASVITCTAIVAPLVANGLFATFISPQAPIELPGAPFFLGCVLCLVALFIAARRPTAQSRAYAPVGAVAVP
jgi:MFS transporter, DHA1 family, tetracycline resistance protein